MALHILARQIREIDLSGPITRAQVEIVLDFHVAMEGDNPHSEQAVAMYFKARAEHPAEIKKGYEVLQAFARQQARTLEQLQALYYSFSNSTKYLRSREVSSACCTTLNVGWEGIYGWRV